MNTKLSKENPRIYSRKHPSTTLEPQTLTQMHVDKMLSTEDKGEYLPTRAEGSFEMSLGVFGKCHSPTTSTVPAL